MIRFLDGFLVSGAWIFMIRDRSGSLGRSGIDGGVLGIRGLFWARVRFRGGVASWGSLSGGRRRWKPWAAGSFNNYIHSL